MKRIVILGNGNTVRDDQPTVVAGGWLKAKIDPDLVRALVAGATHGLLVNQKVPLTAKYRQAFADQAAAMTFDSLTSQGFAEMKEGVLRLLTQAE